MTVTNLRQRLGVALAGTILVFTGVFATAEVSGVADAKKKKKVNRRVGAYQGAVETGGMVSFRITKNRQVVGFTASNVPQRCYTAPLTDPAAQEHPNGTVQFTAPTMAANEGRFFYQSWDGFRPGLQPGPFREIRVQGKPISGTTIEGKVFLHTANGNTDAAGTEVCTTGEPDFTARKLAQGKKKKK